MAKIVMIGIDGLDADLLRVYGPSLPNLRRLMLESPFFELTSSFPPQHDTAWASLYSGLNPANHGILNRVHSSSNNPTLEGKTFWDSSSDAGKRVCILNPTSAYPAWKVNGVMLSVAPHAKGKKSHMTLMTPQGEVSPLDEAETQLSSFLLHPHTLPSSRHLDSYCQLLQIQTVEQAENALALFTRESWDIFFVQLNALDIAQHFLWRYTDPSDPDYPGRKEQAGHIFDLYQLFDRIVGRFRAAMGPEHILFVVSPYGHGRSCLEYVHLNEWLRKQELLIPQRNALHFPDHYYLRYLRKWATYRSTRLLTHLHVQDALASIHGSITTRHMQRSSLLLDTEKAMAQVVDIAGVHSFGGIQLHRTAIERNGKTYDQVRQSLISRLKRLRLKGKPIVVWADTRENIYQGTYIEQYPDILFELRSEFGIHPALYVPLHTGNFMHTLISGSHRMTGVLLAGNVPEEVEMHETLRDLREPTVMDVAPTLLHLLHITVDNLDGTALILPTTITQPTEPRLHPQLAKYGAS